MSDKSTAVTTPRATAKGAWGALGFLCAINVVNYLDKSIFGLVGVPLMKEFNLSPQAFGLINSGFFILFTVSTALLSQLGNKYSTRVLLAILLVTWSVLQLPVAFAGLAVIIVCRLLLGVAEAPSMPWSQHTLQQWFDDRQRQFPTMLLYAFPALVGIVALPTLGWFIAEHGWRSVYVITGVLGLVLGALWAIFGRQGPLGHHADPENQVEAGPKISKVRLLRSSTFLGAVGAMFVAQWFLSLGASWLPAYFEQGLGFGTKMTSMLIGIVFLASAVVMIGFGAVSQRLSRKGWSSRKARVLSMAAAFIASAVSLVLSTVVPGQVLPIVFVAFGLSFGSCGYGLGPVIMGQLVPANQRAGVFGYLYAPASLGAIIAPAVTGFLVGSADTARMGYSHTFLVSAVMSLAVAILLVIFVHPDREQAAPSGSRIPQPVN